VDTGSIHVRTRQFMAGDGAIILDDCYEKGER